MNIYHIIASGFDYWVITLAQVPREIERFLCFVHDLIFRISLALQ